MLFAGAYPAKAKGELSKFCRLLCCVTRCDHGPRLLPSREKKEKNVKGRIGRLEKHPPSPVRDPVLARRDHKTLTPPLDAGRSQCSAVRLSLWCVLVPWYGTSGLVGWHSSPPAHGLKMQSRRKREKGLANGLPDKEPWQLSASRRVEPLRASALSRTPVETDLCRPSVCSPPAHG